MGIYFSQNIGFYVNLCYEGYSKKDFDAGTIQGTFTEIGNTLYITFRATDTNEDWKLHFNCMPLKVPYDNSNTKARVHEGWIGDYKMEGIRNVISKKVINFIKNYAIEKPNIIVLGHSYGGALAMICALDVAYNHGDQCIVRCITFSAPRPGNKAFMDDFSKYVPCHLYLTYGQDIVPMVPPFFLGYRQPNNRMHMGSTNFFNFLKNTLILGWKSLLWKVFNKEIPNFSKYTVYDDHLLSKYPTDYIVCI